MSIRRAIGLSMGVLAAACTPPERPPPLCAGLPLFENERSTGAVPVLIVVENGLGSYFNATDVCILVDGRAVAPEAVAPLVSGFAAHRPLELRVFVRGGVAHEITLRARLRGNTTSRVTGSVSSPLTP